MKKGKIQVTSLTFSKNLPKKYEKDHNIGSGFKPPLD